MIIISALARRAIIFVVARPQLNFFLRRQISRFPAIAYHLRGVVARTRHIGWQPPIAVVLSDDGALSEPAREVLEDLRRALKNAQHRSG